VGPENWNWQYRQEQTEIKITRSFSCDTQNLIRRQEEVMRGQQATGSCVGTAIGQHCDTKHARTSDASAGASTSAAKPPIAMDVDQGGRHPLLKCYSYGKLGHTVKFCRNKRQNLWRKMV